MNDRRMIRAIHDQTQRDRPMTPDAVASEILHGVKDRDWVLRNAPAECRWAGPTTRPPLFSEARIRAWWDRNARKSA